MTSLYIRWRAQAAQVGGGTREVRPWSAQDAQVGDGRREVRPRSAQALAAELRVEAPQVRSRVRFGLRAGWLCALAALWGCGPRVEAPTQAPWVRRLEGLEITLAQGRPLSVAARRELFLLLIHETDRFERAQWVAQPLHAPEDRRAWALYALMHGAFVPRCAGAQVTEGCHERVALTPDLQRDPAVAALQAWLQGRALPQGQIPRVVGAEELIEAAPWRALEVFWLSFLSGDEAQAHARARELAVRWPRSAITALALGLSAPDARTGWGHLERAAAAGLPLAMALLAQGRARQGRPIEALRWQTQLARATADLRDWPAPTARARWAQPNPSATPEALVATLHCAQAIGARCAQLRLEVTPAPPVEIFGTVEPLAQARWDLHTVVEPDALQQIVCSAEGPAACVLLFEPPQRICAPRWREALSHAMRSRWPGADRVRWRVGSEADAEGMSCEGVDDPGEAQKMMSGWLRTRAGRSGPHGEVL